MHTVKCSINASFLEIPAKELLKHSIYVSYSPKGEVVVKKVSNSPGEKSLIISKDDYLSDINGKRMLSEGLDDFFLSGRNEAVIPIVDDDLNEEDGQKLLGFVSVKVIPLNEKTNVTFRRGEIQFDINDNGDGGGKCITSKDCYESFGMCIDGACECAIENFGSFCQVFI